MVNVNTQTTRDISLSKLSFVDLPLAHDFKCNEFEIIHSWKENKGPWIIFEPSLHTHKMKFVNDVFYLKYYILKNGPKKQTGKILV